MVTRSALIAACFTVCAASAQAAELHEVFLVDGGIFPETVYVNIGDTVTFYNHTDNVQTVSATDSSWQINSLYSNATSQLIVRAQMGMTFQFDVASGSPKSAKFSFEPAPTH